MMNCYSDDYKRNWKNVMSKKNCCSDGCKKNWKNVRKKNYYKKSVKKNYCSG